MGMRLVVDQVDGKNGTWIKPRKLSAAHIDTEKGRRCQP
jgi:hypothetical protein